MSCVSGVTDLHPECSDVGALRERLSAYENSEQIASLVPSSCQG